MKHSYAHTDTYLFAYLLQNKGIVQHPDNSPTHLWCRSSNFFFKYGESLLENVGKQHLTANKNTAEMVGILKAMVLYKCQVLFNI